MKTRSELALFRDSLPDYRSDLEPFETSWTGVEVLCTLEDGREFSFRADDEGGDYPVSFETLEGGAEAEKFLSRNEEKLSREWDEQPKYFGRMKIAKEGART